MRRLTAIALLLGVPFAGLHAQNLRAQQVASIDSELAAMAAQGAGYDPQSLDALGLEGLAGVLDRLFPATIAPPKKLLEEDVARLIEQLGDDEFYVRDEATR